MNEILKVHYSEGENDRKEDWREQKKKNRCNENKKEQDYDATTRICNTEHAVKRINVI